MPNYVIYLEYIVVKNVALPIGVRQNLGLIGLVVLRIRGRTRRRLLIQLDIAYASFLNVPIWPVIGYSIRIRTLLLLRGRFILRTLFLSNSQTLYINYFFPHFFAYQLFVGLLNCIIMTLNAWIHNQLTTCNFWKSTA